MMRKKKKPPRRARSRKSSPVDGAPEPVYVRVQHDDFSVDRLISRARRPEAGAVSAFLGTVKSPHEGRRITAIEHDAYVEMAESSLAEIAREAISRHSAIAVAVVHRRGRMRVGENIVGIAASAVKRADAFAACRYIIEELKKRTPLWKKEFAEDGSWWIEGLDEK
jgi:molybdopterin synthase catalytic subunit